MQQRKKQFVSPNHSYSSTSSRERRRKKFFSIRKWRIFFSTGCPLAKKGESCRRALMKLPVGFFAGNSTKNNDNVIFVLEATDRKYCHGINLFNEILLFVDFLILVLTTQIISLFCSFRGKS